MIHASCVALEGRGVLILGPSGAGKSALALQLMALGARLVADDRTSLMPRGGRLIARAPAAIFGRIEARGIGILAADALDEAEIALAVDLGATETSRLPPERVFTAQGCAVPLCHGPATGHFPAALVQYLRAGRIA
ncbi:HPr kinase/phosphorylase [Acidimangrovimonas sediminis]|uniref:HPr kinase/phosphorylase n=1 Tax=Acidimangrovimonas sediminis TaxID=2056283 RepID=UPI000C8053CE|nr:HPr kinase/phosphatase C-terminal domain-containing protein [Acidimangrovimonas sediminis]